MGILIPELSNTAIKILNLLDKCTTPTQLHQIQAQLILLNLYPNTKIAHHFINTCHSLGLLHSAFHLYTKFKKPHVFVCNNLIKVLGHSKLHQDSIFLYSHMIKNSIVPNNYTYPFFLKSLADLGELVMGKCVHTRVIKLSHVNDIYVQNSLLNLYSSCGEMGLCQQLFDEMPQRDVVSWTVMITGFKEAGKFDHALIVFEQMQYAGVLPNQVTMVNALSACASIGALDMGGWIHDFVKRSDWELDVILGTSLVDMYGKCGRIEEGVRVFESMIEKSVYTWNALIKGLALAKSGEQAICWFSKMEQEGVRPDGVTLIAVLCACVHCGMVQFGRSIFASLIVGKYEFSPGVKHYACMVDLLARCGCLEEALKVVTVMPFEPTVSMWGALFAGCRAHGNVELSEIAAWKLVELAPGHSAYYVLLSNLYAEGGRWSDVEKVRKLMKERGLKKDLGSSSVELEPQMLHELLT